MLILLILYWARCRGCWAAILGGAQKWFIMLMYSVIICVSIMIFIIMLISSCLSTIVRQRAKVCVSWCLPHSQFPGGRPARF